MVIDSGCRLFNCSFTASRIINSIFSIQWAYLGVIGNSIFSLSPENCTDEDPGSSSSTVDGLWQSRGVKTDSSGCRILFGGCLVLNPVKILSTKPLHSSWSTHTLSPKASSMYS